MLKIKEVRESKKMSQDEVVRLSGIPKRSYLNYENGQTDVPISKLQKIASVLQVSVSTLINEEKSGIVIKETQEEYGLKDLQTVHLDLKADLKTIHKSLVSGVETISDGVFHGLRDNQKILKFIEQLNPEEINGATRNLNKFLKEHKE